MWWKRTTLVKSREQPIEDCAAKHSGRFGDTIVFRFADGSSSENLKSTQSQVVGGRERKLFRDLFGGICFGCSGTSNFSVEVRPRILPQHNESTRKILNKMGTWL